MKCAHNDIMKIVKIRTVDARDALSPVDGDTFYWHIDEQFLTQDMDKHKIVLAFDKTFQAWQPHFGPIKLKSTGDRKKAAIVIHFMSNGMSGLPERFDPETLAYAFFPRKKSFGIESDMFFNDAYNWGEMHRGSQINLYKVAVHEVGHAFGLEHSSDIKDIMYPTYQPNDTVTITPDTQKGIHKLYGALIKKLTPEVSAPPKPEPEQPKTSSFLDCLLVLFGSWRELAKLSSQQLTVIETILDVSYRIRMSRVGRAKTIFKAMKK